LKYFFYGHNIYIDHKKYSKNIKDIYLNKTQYNLLDKYPFQLDFETNQNRNIYLRIKENSDNIFSSTKFIFVVEDIVSFVCDIKTNQIDYIIDLNCTNELRKYWLTHVLLPLYLTLKSKYYFLHAGSVSIDAQATLFMGDSYAGKSTLTNHFLEKGHPLVSDDKLGTYFINDQFFCQPSHPYHRPYRAVETLGKKANNYCKTSLKIGFIFWIVPVDATEDIKIKELKGLEKFKVLRYATEMDITLNQKKRFQYISKFANALNIYEIKVPRDMKKLDDVYSEIVTHIKTTS